MDRAQLEELIAPVRRRHNRRVLLTLAAFFVTFFGGVAFLEFGLGLYGDDRQYYFNFIFVACVVIFGIGFWRIFTQPKKDCDEFGAVCPSCRSHLYALRGSPLHLKGHCAYCGYQLIDSERAKPGGEKRDPMTVAKMVRLAIVQAVAIGAVYFILWKLGFWP